MTTQLTTTTNKFRLTATLEPQFGRRDKKSGKREPITIRRSYNQEGGQEESVRVHTISPYEQTYSVDVRVLTTTQGRELLQPDYHGESLVFEGELLLENDTDRRYAQDVLDEGRRVRTMTLKASSIRVASADDQIGCDVWLKGQVAQPPRMVPHPQISNLKVAVTTLLVQTWEGRPGSRAVLPRTATISLAVALTHPHSGAVMCVGNEVEVEGMLEVVTVRAGGEAVTTTLDSLKEAWDANADQRARMNADDRFKQERAYRRAYSSRAQEHRTRVVVGFAELLSGRTVEPREAQDIMRRAAKERRQRIKDAERRRAGVSQVSAEAPSHIEASNKLDVLRTRRLRRRDEAAIGPLPVQGIPEATDSDAPEAQMLLVETTVVELVPVALGDVALNGHYDS